MEAVFAVGKPVIVCLMAGSAIDLSQAQEKASAVLQLWYPGARGGKAVADILFGDCSPSGKLPVTFYRSLEGLPDFEDYSMKGRTYRYMEGEALYPFGYGLTYGDVRVESAALSGKDGESGDVTVHVSVKNAGNVATGDVIQIYVKDRESPFAVPNHSLCAFVRVFLEAGERREMEIKVPARAFLVVNDEGEFVPGSGNCLLYVGTGQPDERTAALSGKRSVEIALNPA